MIQTVDFFTPVVDDPYMFGQIAAANALSDIWAMGGEPVVALNIVCFPNCLDPEILGEILAGGAAKVKEAGAVLAGGHSIQDDEPKYGLCVSGIVHPDKIFKNYGARPGDMLLLTKPIGSGIVNTAVKGDMASPEAAKEVIEVMSLLNRKGKKIVERHEVHACTDITGFGLAGHAMEMAIPSKVTLELDVHKIPYIRESLDYADMGLIPAGAYRNRDHLGDKFKYDPVEQKYADLAVDPQTSGGLLIAVPESEVDAILRDADELEMEFKPSVIGRVLEESEYGVVLK